MKLLDGISHSADEIKNVLYPVTKDGDIIFEVRGETVVAIAQKDALVEMYGISTSGKTNEEVLAVIAIAMERVRNPLTGGDSEAEINAMLDYLEGKVSDDALDA